MVSAMLESELFNRMVKNLAPVTSSPQCSGSEVRSRLHIRVEGGVAACRSVDGHRIHEDVIPVISATAEFSCSIDVPRLKAHGPVMLAVEDRVAFVEFENVRFSTPQIEETFAFDSVVAARTGEESHTYRLNGKYLKQAAESLFAPARHCPVLLIVGKEGGTDFVLLETDFLGHRQTRYILPLRPPK